MAFQSFEDLEVWKRASRLAVTVYQLSKKIREFALRDQIQRAAISILSNIAEGSERGGLDFQRFIRIALGSAAELRTQLYIALKLDLLPSESIQPIIKELKEIAPMLQALSRSRSRLKPEH